MNRIILKMFFVLAMASSALNANAYNQLSINQSVPNQPESFSYVYNFTLDALSSVIAFFNPIGNPNGTTAGVNLFTADPLIGSPSPTMTLFADASFTGPGASTDPFSLDAGTYWVEVFGNTAGNNLRFLLSVDSFALAAPIPEPAEWMLMILGLGLVIFIVRRRMPAGGRDIPRFAIS